MAGKRGNDYDRIRHREEDRRIQLIDAGEHIEIPHGELNLSLWERVKESQPAVAWVLGYMAGWEMR